MNERKIVQVIERIVNSEKGRILFYQGTGSEVKKVQKIIKSIESIVTKEQFEQMKYVVEEEE